MWKPPPHLVQSLAAAGLLALMAAVGYGVVTLTPRVIAEYRGLVGESPTVARVYLGVVAAGGLLMGTAAVGAAWFLVRLLKADRKARRLPAPSRLSAAQKHRETRRRLREVERAAERIEGRGGSDSDDGGRSAAAAARGVREEAAEIAGKLEAPSLELVAFGVISAGKSSLLNALLGEERFRTDPRGGTTVSSAQIDLPARAGLPAGRIVLRDTPGLAEVHGARHAAEARARAVGADIVLFVVDGPLRDFEFDAIKALAELEKPIVVCVNKRDRYAAEDLAVVVGQVAEQVAGIVPRKSVVPVAARAGVSKRVRVKADGTEVEEAVAAAPDVSGLEARLEEVAQEGGRDLLLANLVVRSRALAERARAMAKGEDDAMGGGA